ncbi:hypothetical protein C0991_000508, partial [Blastosporella zonata]
RMVLPYALTTDPLKAGKSSDVLIITNTPSQRFDVYSGPFTKNDQLSTSFYTDKLLFLPDIEVSIAQKVLDQLKPTHSNKRGLIEEDMDERDSVEERYRAWLQDMHERSEIERRDVAGLTLGYVTKDVSTLPSRLRLRTSSSIAPHTALFYRSRRRRRYTSPVGSLYQTS